MLTDILQKCIAIYEKHNVHDMEVENDDDLSRKYSLMLIYEQLSTYYKEQKQYQTALIWTEKLLNLEQYFYDAKGVNSLRFYQESAEIYALQNKFESAIEYYNKALELQKEAKKS
jgi:tetratricopeptide (TPR) repeat protein